jgi:hypothetical protein
MSPYFLPFTKVERIFSYHLRRITASYRLEGFPRSYPEAIFYDPFFTGYTEFSPNRLNPILSFATLEFDFFLTDPPHPRLNASFAYFFINLELT